LRGINHYSCFNQLYTFVLFGGRKFNGSSERIITLCPCRNDHDDSVDLGDRIQTLLSGNIDSERSFETSNDWNHHSNVFSNRGPADRLPVTRFCQRNDDSRCGFIFRRNRWRTFLRIKRKKNRRQRFWRRRIIRADILGRTDSICNTVDFDANN